MPLDNRTKTFDVLGLIASFATAIVTSTLGTCQTAQDIFDCGGGRTEGHLVIDVISASLGTIGNNVYLNYNVILQGSNSSTFATPIANLCVVALGPNSTASAAKLNVTGPIKPGAHPLRAFGTACRRVVPFSNDYAGTIYRYLRTWATSAGTIVTGIVYKAWVTK